MGPDIPQENWEMLDIKVDPDAVRKYQVYSSFFGMDDSFDADEDKIKEAIDFAYSLRREAEERWSPAQPPSDANIWRYLNFTQLLSILERNQIWFTNVNSFEDPYEGTIPLPNLKEEVDSIIDSTGVSRKDAIAIHSRVLRPDSPAASRGYVNCWNVSEHQSAALWEQYVNSPQGVAIRTTVDNLKTSLTDFDRELIFGEVVYIDYESDSISRGDLPTIYHKRKSFEHESEFRVALLADDDDDFGTGFYADSDVDSLLEEIVISPIAPDWFSSLVERVLTRYEVNCELSQSELYSTPDVSLS